MASGTKLFINMILSDVSENRTNHRGRWGSDRETFQEKAFRCLTLLFEKVPAKRRNFILDVKSCTLEITQRYLVVVCVCFAFIAF